MLISWATSKWVNRARKYNTLAMCLCLYDITLKLPLNDPCAVTSKSSVISLWDNALIPSGENKLLVDLCYPLHFIRDLFWIALYLLFSSLRHLFHLKKKNTLLLIDSNHKLNSIKLCKKREKWVKRERVPVESLMLHFGNFQNST